jgi:hypothetical protein
MQVFIKLYNTGRLRNYLAYFLFCIGFSSALIVANGTYYGWIDDAMMANLFRGILIPQPVYHPHEFTGFAPLLIYLYKTFPAVAWYGWFIYALLFFAYSLLANVFYTLTERQVRGSILKLALVAITFSLLMQEFIQRNNFTVLGCLLTGAGVLFYSTQKQTVLNIFLSAIAVLSGLLIRFEISFIILVFSIGSSLTLAVIFGNTTKRNGLLALMAVCVALHFGIRYLNYNKDAIDFNGLSVYEQLIQDAYIYPEKVSEIESLKLEAVRGFNQFDTRVIDENYFKGLYGDYSLSWSAIRHLVINKLQRVYEFGNRYQQGSLCLNWWARDVFLFCIAVFYAVVALLSGYSRKTVIAIWLIITGAAIIILAVAILAKIEDRLLGPLLVLLNLFVLAAIHYNAKSRALPLFIVLAPLLLLGAYRFEQCAAAHTILAADIEAKRAFIEELNRHEGKIILFDMYTAYLLHLGPFENIYLSKKNEYNAGFHYIVRHFYSTQNYFGQLCGTNKTDEIIRCLYSKKDNVLFAYYTYNIDFLARWSQGIYNQPVQFVPTEKGSHLGRTSNVYIWGKMQHNYFIFK